MKTNTLPTDKNGNVYYGCRTFAQAESAIQEASFAERKETAERIAKNMERGGFARIASKVRREYLN